MNTQLKKKNYIRGQRNQFIFYPLHKQQKPDNEQPNVYIQPPPEINEEHK